MSSLSHETICALASGSGPSAISVIRVSGQRTFFIVNEVFYGKDLKTVPTHTIHLGTIRSEEKVIDEVLVSVFKGPKSYTGEDVIEIACHGSPYVRNELLNLLIEKGARAAQPGEFTLRAFINGKLDLSQAEAVSDLINADSEAAHKLAMQQMRGGFSKEIALLRKQLIDFASLIELELDFSEEDVEFANRDDLDQLLTELHKFTFDLIQSFKVGNVLKNGVPVVIAGKPNAGKSTLLNQLLKDDRAIVSEIAGTTRDVIEDEMVIDGVVFRFFDTAGIRETTDHVEAIGVKKTLEKMASAAVVLYVFDADDMAPDELRTVYEDLQTAAANNKAQLLMLANKMEGKDEKKIRSDYSYLEEIIFLSAKTGDGLKALENKLLELVNLDAISGEDVVVTNSRHYDSLTKANASIVSAQQGLQNGITGDFIAMDIRQALHYLGEITGEISNDELLGNIFSNFCIGK